MTDESTPRLRVDKWLWQARFFKSRSEASRMCAGSKLRINRQVVSKAATCVKVGDVLTFPRGRNIRVIKVLALGTRRGPASEAQLLYEDLAPPEPSSARAPAGAPPAPERGSGRPTKRDRRRIERLRQGVDENEP